MSTNDGMDVDEKMELMEVKDEEEESDDEESSEEEEEVEDRIYLPGTRLEEGEELEIDENAYVVYHQVSPCVNHHFNRSQNKALIWQPVLCTFGKIVLHHPRVAVLSVQASLGPPCLSFDIIPEQSKADFPLSVTAVAGTQAAKVDRQISYKLLINPTG